MKKMILKVLLLIAICMLLIIPMDYLFQNNDGIYTYRMMNEMYNCEDNIDVLFLGSSHVFRSYDTKLADELLGVKTFNAGSASQPMNASYYLLKEISQYHSLKTVYLDTYYGIATISENDLSIYYISDYMRTRENKTNLLLSNGGINSLINGYVTIRRNGGNFNIIKNIMSRFSDISDYTSVTYENEEYRGDGFVYNFEIADADDDGTYASSAVDLSVESEEMPVSDLYYQSLLSIVRFCSENNIELILVNQPMPKRTLDLVIGYDNYVQFIKQIASDNGLQYWNFALYMGDIGLTMDDYMDGQHLNGKGAEIYTEFICNFINEVKNKDSEQYFYSSYQ